MSGDKFGGSELGSGSGDAGVTGWGGDVDRPGAGPGEHLTRGDPQNVGVGGELLELAVVERGVECDDAQGLDSTSVRVLGFIVVLSVVT